jgi:hypothetical protein
VFVTSVGAVVASGSCAKDAVRLFSKPQAAILCKGAAGGGPIICAKDQRAKQVGAHAAVRLCQQATHTTPHYCFTASRRANKALSEDEAVELCWRAQSDEAERCVKTANACKLDTAQVVELCRGGNGVAAAHCMQAAKGLKKLDADAKVGSGGWRKGRLERLLNNAARPCRLAAALARPRSSCALTPRTRPRARRSRSARRTRPSATRRTRPSPCSCAPTPPTPVPRSARR